MNLATEINGRLGYRTIALRNENRISVEDLSEASGLTPSMIRKVERGNRNFRSHTLCQLAKTFKVDPDYFMIRDIYLAQAMRDPVFAAHMAEMARQYFERPGKENPAA
ncbi:hypothetical protein LCGC14_2814090 [marine sediment metagenome]|uniref:HTH cro/C1-type domain-containing protein n=1 Tax=marine sediment metagenome TaxID=412755 RepID=A0A0F8YJ31_9ZZZZ